MKNTYTSGLLSGFLLNISLAFAFFAIAPIAKAALPEGNIIKGERPVININALPADAFEEGIIRIKFDRSLESYLDNVSITSSPTGVIQFGLSGIDQLNQQFGVVEVRKTFAAALQNTKYTERHRQWGFHLWYDLIVPAGTDVRNMVVAYSAHSEIQLSEPVYRKQLVSEDLKPLQAPKPSGGNTGVSYVPNDPRYNEQWHYNNTGQQAGTPDSDIDLPEAWDITRGNSSVVVAIIDQGVEYTHTDLAANMWPGNGYNFVNNNATIIPGNHGTHVAGTVAANTNNGTGVSGIAGGSGAGYGVRIMSCQVFIEGGSSGGFQTAPVWAADNGAAISQNSWNYTYVGVYDQVVLDAIDYFNANGGGTVLNGGITIFSAGNNSASGLWYPACYSGAFAIAATNNQDLKSWYSNYASWVDISAPGGETFFTNDPKGVLSTLLGNTYGFYQGTSMACPHASGVAALIVSLAPGILTAQNVRDILTSTTDNINALNPTYAGLLGTGRLNAYQALLATQPYLVLTANFSASSTTPAINTTVTFTDLTNNSPTTWAWSFSPNSVVYVGGTSASSQNPQVQFTAPGPYTVALTAGNGSSSDSEVKTNYINAVTPAYCSPLYSTGTSDGDYISLVQLGSINNVSGASASPYYTYFSSLSTNLTPGSAYTITLSPGTYGEGNYFSVWIDYNHNSIFDANEVLGNILVNAPAPATGTITFTVPVNALSGTTRMRVREVYGTVGFDPCSTYSYGETEDYNVNITPVSYCTPTYGSGSGSGDYISLVQLGSINNYTGASSSPFYTHYNTMSTNLDPGTEYTITLSAGTYPSDNNISVWIDYNFNGVFEATEKLGNIVLVSGPTTGTLTFTVPLSALSGTTRMRVREVYSEPNISPCGDFYFGETEDYNVNITGSDKTLNLAVYLEGLYSGSGSMSRANDDMGPKYAAGIADQISVELHNQADYSIIEYSVSNVNLGTNGQVSIPVPSGLSGSYYLTVKHRNSIETTSASPISFASPLMNYEFDVPAKAYGNNMLLMIDGYYTIFGGDVNQDGYIDTGDMTPVDNDGAAFQTGYLPTDCNGDGFVDTGDMTIIDNNGATFVGTITP
jgi:subtilisin family serine protease